MEVDEGLSISAAAISLVLIYFCHSQSRGRPGALKQATATRKRKLSSAAPLKTTKRRAQTRSRQHDSAEQDTSGGNSNAVKGGLIFQVCHYPLA